MDIPMASLVTVEFSHFSFITQTDRLTDVDERFTPTNVSVNNKSHKS